MSSSRLKRRRYFPGSVIFVRNVGAMNQLEIFLVSAVTTILLIRLFLELTGYPQIGNDSLHIAHMLWGGLGMLVAALMRLMLLGKWVEYASSFIGGVGFGAFIDEIGKFVTQDNDYFFAPSFSLMYVIFVLIYLTAHWALTSRGYSRTEYLMNAVNLLQEYRDGYLREDQVGEIRFLLGKSDPANRLAESIGTFVDGVDREPERGPGPYERLKQKGQGLYHRIIENRLFAPLLNLFFIIQLLVGLGYIIVEVLFPSGYYKEPTTSEIALLISSSISALFIFLGVIQLRRSRFKAYRMFERAMLVNLLLSQIFLFTIDQLGAMTGFIFSLLVLGALRVLIEQEKERLIAAGTEAA